MQLLQILQLPLLQHLTLRLDTVQRDQPLLLQHLGSVTCLDIPSTRVQQGDELPPALQQLECFDVHSVEPLCRLTSLAGLSVQAASTRAAQLQQLGHTVRSLRTVELQYFSANKVKRGAAGWAALPLNVLEINTAECTTNYLERTGLQCLALQQGLKELHLRGCWLSHGAEQQLAGALARLTNLQSLILDGVQFDEAEDEQEQEEEEEEDEVEAGVGQHQAAGGPAVAAAAGQPAAAPGLTGWPSTMRAAADLPQLQALSFTGAVTAAEVEQLVAATQLQELAIKSDFDPQDHDEEECEEWRHSCPGELVLIDLLCCLPGLRNLELCNQPHLSDAAMPVIGLLLTQLNMLTLDYCPRISNTGIAYLTGLRQLSSISVEGTRARRAAACSVLPGVLIWT
jgi:hypothetical protein